MQTVGVSHPLSFVSPMPNLPTVPVKCSVASGPTLGVPIYLKYKDVLQRVFATLSSCSRELSNVVIFRDWWTYLTDCDVWLGVAPDGEESAGDGGADDGST